MTGDPPPDAKKGPKPGARATGSDTIPEGPSSATDPPPPTRADRAFGASFGHSGRTGKLGRYTLLWELGRGGMGEVYLAVDKELDREVAVKVIRADRTMTPKRQERFMREAQAMGRLNHPNIARVLDIGREGEIVYFAMDYVQGRSLLDRIKEGPVPLDEALRITALLARALHHAHRRGVIHRDVKPGNVLLTVDGEPMLTDFGIAKHSGDEASDLTLPGDVFGTPAYMAPEQARGDANLTEAVDLYALGAVLYELVCGHPPFGGNPQQVTAALLSHPPPPLAERAPGVPSAVAAICDCAMARRPGDRYASAEAMAEDLERARAGLQVHPPRPSLLRRVRRALLSRGGPLVVGALVVVLPLSLLAAQSVYVQHLHDEREERAQARLAALLQQRAEDIAAGRDQEADEALRAFTELEEHRGTRALYAAFRAQADECLAEGDLDCHLSALARAYASVDDPDLQVEALLGLADAFRQSWRWTPLETLLHTADELGLDDPSLAGMLAQVRLAKGDLPGALEVWPTNTTDDPDALAADVRPLVEALMHGRHLGQNSVVVSPIDLDADGHQELLTVAGTDLSVLYPSQPDRPATRWETPTPHGEHSNLFAFQPANGPLTLLSSYTDARLGWGSASWILEGGTLIDTKQTDLPLLMSAASADLDGDGVQETYLGASGHEDAAPRLLQAIQNPDRTWRFEVPEPETAYAASGINRLLAADLDEDGVQELLATPGSWTAFDLRALTWTGEPAQDGVVPLKVRARARLGLSGGITLLRDAASGRLNLIFTRSNAAPSRRVFPADAPLGPPGDVWRVTLDEDGFDVTPFPMHPLGPSYDIRTALGGDIDGDGLDDLVLDVHRAGASWGVMLFRQRPNGSFASALLGGGLHATHLIQADDDPQLELIVKYGESVIAVLGVGETPFHLIREAEHPAERGLGAVTENDLLDKELADDTARAELLADLGLYAAAADVLATLASFAINPEDAARLYLRAGQLATLADDETTAARQLIQASTVPRPDVDVLDETVRRLTDLHYFDEAYDALLRLMDLVPLDLAATRRSQLSVLAALRDTPTFTPAWDDPAWIVHVPDALRRGEEPGSVEVHAYSDHTELATLPLTCDAPRIGLSVDMTVHEGEWAAGLELMLYTDDPDLSHGVSFTTEGGGLIYMARTSCFIPGERRGALTPSSGAPRPDRRWSASVDIARDARSARCVITGDDVNPVSTTRSAPASPPVGGPKDWNLLIRHNRGNGVTEPLLAHATLKNLQLTGCRLRDDAGGARATSDAETLVLKSHHALLRRDPAAALSALRGLSGPTARAARVVALNELGRAGEAAKLGLADTTEPVKTAVAHLLRSSRAFNAAARAVSATLHLARFTDAWESVLHHHPDSLQTERALSDWVGDLNALANAPLTAESARQLGLLLVRRADLQQREDLYSSALGTLDTVIHLADERRGRGQLTDPKLLAEAWRLRSQVQLREGDVAAAFESARKSIEVSQSPLLQRDRLVLIPELQPHLNDPEWASLLGL
ncbi:serine/threonine protein kinase [Myxococcota bacterium]|nr:serine/threonine protein kinase [Myxococcota bacterium]